MIDNNSMIKEDQFFVDENGDACAYKDAAYTITVEPIGK